MADPSTPPELPPPGELRVLLFAGLRERAGWRERRLTATSGTTPAAVWEQLGLEPADAAATIRVAINQQFAPWDSPLAGGDELAFLPPISGG
jgi:molybdopterin synthase sulfur carrier subunit